jgi:hypothetical protein
MVKVTPNPPAFERARELTQAIKITHGDMAGPALRALGTVHRMQEKAIFASKGTVGGYGQWAPLNKSYAERKKKLVGRKPDLVLTGRMKASFTMASSGNYVQLYSPRGEGLGIMQFGARSAIASAHLTGDPTRAPNTSFTGRRLFGGIAPRLPIRDMITKSNLMIGQLSAAFKEWYIKKVKQVIRGASTLGGR